jgi:STE24 endopeptidase
MVQLNLLFLVFLAFFLLRSVIQLYLDRLNLFHLRQHGSNVPDVFKDVVNDEKLKTMINYTIDSTRLSRVATVLDQGVLLVILLSGFLPWLTRMSHRLEWGLVVEGLLFFGILSLILNLFRLPFNLYDTFVIEERYGFNTMTLKTWICDLVKGLAISMILGGLILSILLVLILHGGTLWWLWAWMLLGAYELLVLWLFPVVIAPLFNKFEPVEDKKLIDHIEALTEKVGIRVKGVLRMDASKRSKHTNAYFTGIGKTKRIVLFDTLMTSHREEEILAVLAHEIGHWKKKHVIKELLLVEGLSLVGLYITARLLEWPLLYETFGFQSPVSYAGLFLIAAILSPLAFFAEPLESSISRAFEREADDFSLELMKTGDPLRSALKRLAADNLANLSPHPLYAWFYYSHPPLVERITRLEGVGEKIEATP